MHTFFSELQKAREAQGITLEQISARTRIDIRFLRALEEGNVTILPEAYIRAFLKEYALAAGLDVEHTMAGFLDATGKKPDAPVPPSVPTFEDTVAPRKHAEEPTGKTSLPMRPWTKLAYTAVALVGMLLIAWFLIPHEDPEPVQETPFDKVIREAEQRAAPRQADGTGPRATSDRSIGDSLTLTGKTFDSVWLQVVADTSLPQEHLLPANTSMTWRAREKFTLVLGNAGGIRFALGKDDLGFLGKPGAVLRNIQITRMGVLTDTTATP